MTNSQFAKIVIYAHRGIWGRPSEQNSYSAIAESNSKNFGAEIDVRSLDGEIILSHDPVMNDSYCKLHELSKLQLPLAINLKEDGLLQLIQKSSILNNSLNSFIFDGSIPQMLLARRLGLRHALRISEYEKVVGWHSDFIWLDSFESDWWLGDESILDFLKSNKVIVVSSELHNRKSEDMWKYLRNTSRELNFNFGICTDKPDEFKDFIYG